MFPLSDSIKSPRFPYLNIFLVVATIYVFVQQILSIDQIAFINQYALIPINVNFTNPLTLVPFITAIFLHGGLMHILSNMWFMVVFGDNVETHIGFFAFLLLYFVSGVGGFVSQYLVMPSSSIPMLGASGAVAGILGCYYVLFPHSKIKTLLTLFFFITIVEISAPFMLGYWFVLQLFSAVGSTADVGTTGGVAFFAHIGGFIVGVVFGYLFKNKARVGVAETNYE